MIPRRIEKILDLARWAPSGDNTQPWRFEIVDDFQFVIHGRDTRDWCVYDLDGRASQTAIGALMENIVIAASGEGQRAEFNRREDAPETEPTIQVTLIDDPEVPRDPLVDYITARVTQRRPLSTAPLTREQKQALEQSIGPNHSVVWNEGSASRRQMARLLSHNAKIRLTIPEAYEVHRRIIEWDAQFSDDRIPDQAVGLDPVGLKLMRWAMASWRRVDFLNRYLAGTLLPRLQLDLVPGYLCGAHFLICAHTKPRDLEDFLDGGRAVQRFWLTATQLGLQFQPEMTPLIFSRYLQAAIRFTGSPSAMKAAKALYVKDNPPFTRENLERGVFLGRLGSGNTPKARSLRVALAELLRR